MRDIAEIKLFFNELAESGQIARLAHDQVQQHQHRIADYEAMRQRFGDSPDLAPRMITLELGLEMEYAALRFWRRLAARHTTDTASSGRSHNRE